MDEYEAHAIVIKDHPVSEKGWGELMKSHQKVGNDFSLSRFDAFTEKDVNPIMKQYRINWNWPWSGSHYDTDTKIRKVAYGTKVKERRIACALSHYFLWKKCADEDRSILILEHDAIFIDRVPISVLLNSKYSVIGLNDPANATRKSPVFDKIVKEGKSRGEELIPVPNIDKEEIAQGLAGASAYLIKPDAASELITKVSSVGLWPNDALICRQLFDFIGVSTKYYTKVQGLVSTTTR